MARGMQQGGHALQMAQIGGDIERGPAVAVTPVQQGLAVLQEQRQHRMVATFARSMQGCLAARLALPALSAEALRVVYELLHLADVSAAGCQDQGVGHIARAENSKWLGGKEAASCAAGRPRKSRRASCDARKSLQLRGTAPSTLGVDHYTS